MGLGAFAKAFSKAVGPAGSRASAEVAAARAAAEVRQAQAHLARAMIAAANTNQALSRIIAQEVAAGGPRKRSRFADTRGATGTAAPDARSARQRTLANLIAELVYEIQQKKLTLSSVEIAQVIARELVKKGGPVLNDAEMNEAVEAVMLNVARVASAGPVRSEPSVQGIGSYISDDDF